MHGTTDLEDATLRDARHRILATTEGGALPINKQRILDSTDEDTRVSTAYTGKTLRASYNKFHDSWAASGMEAIPFPGQVVLSSALLHSFIMADKLDYVGGLAGQVSGIIHEVKPAAQVLEEIVLETVEILSRRLPSSVVAQ
jgi:nitronate monooxygenase